MSRRIRTIPVECVLPVDVDDCAVNGAERGAEQLPPPSRVAVVHPAVLRPPNALVYQWEVQVAEPAVAGNTSNELASDPLVSLVSGEDDVSRSRGGGDNDSCQDVPSAGASTVSAVEDQDVSEFDKEIMGIVPGEITSPHMAIMSATAPHADIEVHVPVSDPLTSGIRGTLGLRKMSVGVGQGTTMSIAQSASPSNKSKSAQRKAKLAGSKAANAVTSAMSKGRFALLKPRSTRGLTWTQLDATTEAELLKDVPADDLKPCLRPVRSEKATMLLYGYVSEADKAALRRSPSPPSAALSALPRDAGNDSLSGSDSAPPRAIVPPPHTLGREDEDADAARLKPFLDMEEQIERRRFATEKWLDKIVLFQSLDVLKKVLLNRFAQKTIADVATPRIVFRMRKWLTMCRRQLLTQSLFPSSSTGHRVPPSQLLKKKCRLLMDWPMEAIDGLLAAGTLVAYRQGEVIFFEGEPTQETYVLCTGEVHAVVMRSDRCRAKVYMQRYIDSKALAQANSSNDGISGRSAPSSCKKRLHPTRHDTRDALIVDYYLDATLFGMEAVLCNREPRAYSAWCNTDCVLLRIARDDAFTSMAPLPDLTRASLVASAWQQRHQYVYGNAFPIPLDTLSYASQAFALWHGSALQDLMPRSSIQVFSKGEVLFRQGDIEPVGKAALLMILRGRVRRLQLHFTSADGYQCLTPFDVVGEEELVLSSFAHRETLVAEETTEALVVLQEDYLAVARCHGECGTFSRDAIASKIAKGFVKPTSPPIALLRDPTMRFIFPERAMETLWRDHATPRYILQGDPLFRTWDEASHVFLILSGTLSQVYGPHGPRVPIANLNELQHGSVRDDEVQTMQNEGIEENDLYNAINSPGAFMKKAAAMTPKAGGQRSGGANAGQNALPPSHVWIPLERNLVLEDEPLQGVVLGAIELALQETHYLSHVRATSNVVVWQWSRSVVERLLQQQHPGVWTAMMLPASKDVVRKHFLGMTLRLLAEEAAPRSAD